MSILPSHIPDSLPFYLSGPRPCPYLPGRIERKLFTHLSQTDALFNAEINSALCRAGFRRSQTVVYRPACNDCRACVPVRIPVKDFIPSRSQRRVMKRNSDLHAVQSDPDGAPDLFALFSAYQKSRHDDSDMAYMTKADFTAMLKEGPADTHLYLLVDENDAVTGCMIADHVSDGLSAVYSFFDPNESRRSLGTALILSLVTHAKERGLPYIYLGYWIEDAKKMLYKTRFHPLQSLSADGWTPLKDMQVLKST